MTVRRKVRVVAALIADPQTPSRYLVQQRLPGKSRGLLWEFPGGKVEAGESDADALVRECHEELGVALEAGRTVWSGIHDYEDLSVELVLLEAKIASGEPVPLGANDLRYLSPREMKALPFCEADLPLLDALDAGELTGRT